MNSGTSVTRTYIALAMITILIVLAGSESGCRQDLTPSLCEAAKKGDTEAVEVLLSRGADVNGRDNLSPIEMIVLNRTALMYASQEGHTRTVQVLVKAGADVNANGDENITALALAALNGHTETVQTLLAAGANLEYKAGPEGQTALFVAAAKSHIGTVTFLRKNGADIEAKQQSGITPLMAAVMNGDTATAKALL
jgi:uncharacterized protein